MKDVELYALGGMSSSSPAMFERRRRILNEARRLIGRGHPDGFSVRDLCERAGVSPNTLYNAFGSKENVITLAITQYFEEFHAATKFEHPVESFEGVIEREVATTLRNLEIPHFVNAITTLYFSTSEPPLRAALTAIGERPYRRWLETMQMQKQLERGVSVDRASKNLSHLLYALVREWRSGGLADDEFVTVRLDAVLSYLSGITKARARKDVRCLLADLFGSRSVVDAMIERARRQIHAKRSASAK